MGDEGDEDEESKRCKRLSRPGNESSSVPEPGFLCKYSKVFCSEFSDRPTIHLDRKQLLGSQQLLECGLQHMFQWAGPPLPTDANSRWEGTS